MSLLIKYFYLLIIGTLAGLIAGGLGTSTAYALVLGLVFSGVSKDYKHAAALTLFTILPPISLGAVYTYYKEKMIDIPAGLFLMVVCFSSGMCIYTAFWTLTNSLVRCGYCPSP